MASKNVEEDILKAFLIQNKAEAITMSIYEYDEEKHIRMEREEAFRDGFKDGQAAERENTERERANAKKAQTNAKKAQADAERERLRADNAEAEAEKSRELLKKYEDLSL